MAYDVELADRLRAVLHGEPGLSEKPMFGGLAFLIDGRLAASASGQGGILLRIDPAETATLLQEPFVDRFEMRGRQLEGWLRLAPQAVRTDDALRGWVARGVAYARSLPAA